MNPLWLIPAAPLAALGLLLAVTAVRYRAEVSTFRVGLAFSGFCLDLPRRPRLLRLLPRAGRLHRRDGAPMMSRPDR